MIAFKKATACLKKATLLCLPAGLQADCQEMKVENKYLKTRTTVTQGSVTKLQADCNKLKTENESLKTRATETQGSVTILQADCKQLKTENQTLKEENTQLRRELTALSQEVKTKVSVEVVPRTSIPLGPPVLIMTDVKQHKKDGNIWYSPPVYTHHHGYNICLEVYANGINSGAGTHVSVYILFVRGDFDASLKWPFRGVIAFRLLDQLNGEQHKTFSVIYENSVRDRVCSRVTEGERAKFGQGENQFIAHTLYCIKTEVQTK